MAKIIPTTDKDDRTTKFEYEGIPDQCPFCHLSIVPIILEAYSDIENNRVTPTSISRVIYQCPVNDCGNIFIGQYFLVGGFFRLIHVYPIFPKDIIFSGEISNISPDFVAIYNQAYKAEQQHLTLIAGPGYRKSLEFLIKDYAIKYSETDKADKIKNKLLGPVIEEYIDNSKIKSMSKRAAWLGNDETHYLRKWEDKDLKDLKILIDLTVKYIEMEELSKAIEHDMPD